MRFRQAPSCLRPAIVAGLVSAAAIATADWTVIKLHPGTGINSFVNGAYGQQQVGQARVDNGNHASIWSGSAASWIDVHPAAANSSNLVATNGVWQGGSVSVDVGSTSEQHASLWNGTAASWVDLHPPLALESHVHAMDDSQQVGVARIGLNYHAGIWTGSAGTWLDLHPAGATFSFAKGVHAGQQVGYARFGDTDRAALWTGSAASFVDLSPGGAESHAYAVHNGQQVGDVVAGEKEFAAVWSGTASSIVSLNPAGAHSSRAVAVHNGEQAGRAVYVVTGQPIIRKAAFWQGTAESYQDLSQYVPSDLHSAAATSISHVGSVTYVGGTAKYPPPTGALTQGIVWVSNEPAAPLFLTLLQGFHVSGGVPEVRLSDDQFYVAQPNYNVPRTSPPLQIEVGGTAHSANVLVLKFRLEAAGSTTGGTQTISLYNFATNTYDLLDSRALAATDYKTDVVVTSNAGQYVHPVSRDLKAKINVFPPTNASRSWALKVDEASWGVTQP